MCSTLLAHFLKVHLPGSAHALSAIAVLLLLQPEGPVLLSASKSCLKVCGRAQEALPVHSGCLLPPLQAETLSRLQQLLGSHLTSTISSWSHSWCGWATLVLVWVAQSVFVEP